jgi:hypothetical protein
MILSSATGVSGSPENMQYFGRGTAFYAISIAVGVVLLIYFGDRLWAFWVWVWT